MKERRIFQKVFKYNIEKYLEECLDSLRNHTLKKLGIIAVDDGSADDSMEILKEYEKRYLDKLKVFHRKMEDRVRQKFSIAVCVCGIFCFIIVIAEQFLR